MKRELQLYIQDTRVDLFKDETVSLTDTIQNVRDIAKIFTTFTKTFTLPASQVNNKLFQHYYNFDILNPSTNKSAFDARIKVTARLELNHIPYKDGKIKLEGVDMKNNQPYAYRVTFFGNTVDLKDIIGEDKLNVLTSLDSLKKDFNATNIKTYLETNPASSDIIVPLITHTQRLFYNSSSSAHTDDTGNLYYHTGSSHDHGVRWDNLKYAIRVHNIIEAIETKYGLTFSSDFFTETSNDQYSKLFMWLHRKKGVVETGSQIANFPSIVDGWSTGVGTSSYTQMVTTTTLRLTEDAETFGTDFTLTLTGATGTYDILIEKDGVSYYSENGISSATKIIDLHALNGGIAQSGDYTVTITVTSAVSFNTINWSITTDEFGTVITDQFNTGSYTASATFEFVITSQMPEMKVIDFLSGIFKMFNLTAFVNNSGTIVVKTLDSYYTGGTSYDITEYVDIEQGQVNVALPFKEISFGYEDTDSFFSAIHNQLFNKEWGTVDYNDNESLDGGLYKIELPFGHMKFEKLIDINGSNDTDTQWGWSVDDNQDSYIGKPVLFYPVYTSVGSKTISFVDVINTSTGEFANNVEITGSINMPSNSVAFATATSTANINFFNELNEYEPNEDFSGTLFKNYYETYIKTVFNSKNRLTKIKARLPMNILLNYSLADKFRIEGTEYRINSITTNLTTGEADIELLNVL